MADKASRALVVYGDGLVRQISSSHFHLHDLVSRGSSGFLSLTKPPHPESEDERVVRELAQLLDAYDGYIKRNGENSATDCVEKSTVTTISDRFMGMRAAILTTNSSVKSFGSYLGLTVLEFDELSKNKGHPNEPPASEMLKLLGFEGGKVLETCKFDLVFVHIGQGEKTKIPTMGDEVEWVNALVGGILEIAQPGSEISSRLHLSVVMSYGAPTKDEAEDNSLLQLSSQNPTNSDLSSLFPRQSYTMKGVNLVNSTRYHCPMLVAQWQDAVTRKDTSTRFSFQEFKENGGNLAIPADRFLHEVAFKLWKAPKYGA